MKITNLIGLIGLCVSLWAGVGRAQNLGDLPDAAWSTFLGGNGADVCRAVATDGQGNVLVGGETTSTDLPAQNGVFKTYNGGDLDGFVAKFNAAGQLLWLTYLGGNSSDSVYGIAVDRSGNIFVTGYTGSGNFPVSDGSTNKGNHDAFIAKFDPNGQRLWATFLGGTNTDEAYAIAVDETGNAYVTGRTGSGDFSVKNAYQGTQGGGFDAFVSKITGNGALAWSTFLGGNEKDPVNYPEAGFGIVVYKDVGVWVVGQTSAPNFPATPGLNQTLAGLEDAFVAGYTLDGRQLWATLLGGDGQDYANGLTVDGAGNLYVVGRTNSDDFPGIALNGDKFPYGGGNDGFISRIGQDARTVWTLYLGGSGDDEAFAAALDQKNGLINVAGVTGSANFPAQAGGPHGQDDAFVLQFNSDGKMVHSADWGGSALDWGMALASDPDGRVILAGKTASGSDFPLTNAADNTFGGGGLDGFVSTLTWRNAARQGWTIYQ